MFKPKRLPVILLALVLVFNSLTIGTSAVLNDGNMLSADVNLEVGTLNGSVFTPLAAGTALHAGDVITVRISPACDFYCGIARYVVMFSSAYFSIVGSDASAFTPNTANTFYAAVASGYSAATAIPVSAWPASLQSQFDTYKAVAVNNTANFSSGNGGYPGFLPGDWLFRFNLTVTQDIAPTSGARIWMDTRWFRSPANTSAAAYFTKCTSATQLSASGSSTLYYFDIDLTDADINLDPVTLTAKAGSTAIINQSMGFIYGLEEGLSKTAFLNNFVQINGNGSLRVTYFTDSFGTQTKAELIDNETSAVVKTYYIIIFGDVDGDGYITVGDENLISLVASYQSEFDAGSAFGFAADLTRDELVDTFDLNLVSAATSYTGTIDQTNPGELI